MGFWRGLTCLSLCWQASKRASRAVGWKMEHGEEGGDVSQLVECLPTMHEALVLCTRLQLGLVAQAYNSRYWEIKTGRLGVQVWFT